MDYTKRGYGLSVLPCELCGKPFHTRASQRRAGFAKYCSKPCSNRARKRSLEDRFWSFVDRRGPDECWPFTGSRDRDGYGLIGSEEFKQLRAPRVAYALKFGEIPDGKCVRHNCDNPACVNWRHLTIGTVAENNKDKAIRERGKGKGGYVWTDEQRRKRGELTRRLWLQRKQNG